MFNPYSQFQAIAGNASSGVKVQLIKQFAADPVFVEVLRLAYDPTITFGVAAEHRGGCFRIGPYGLSEGGARGDWAQAVSVLSALQRRVFTGSNAHAALISLLDGANFETQWVICGILNKDLRIGIGAKTINKALPGLVPDFSCMLAQRDATRIEYPARVELKYNGDRNFAIIESRAVTFLSRTGKVIPGHNSLRAEILSIFPDGWVLDGEHMKGVWGDESRDAPMVVYDLLPVSAFRAGQYSAQFRHRRQALEAWLPGEYEFLELAKGQNVWTQEGVDEYFSRVCDAGGEGVVVKPLSGLYEFKRSFNWVKIKPTDTVEAPIVGYVESKKREGELGAVIVEFEGKHFKLGAGFSPAQRVDLWNAPQILGRVVEFKYSGLTPYGIPLCAAFKRFRDDLGE